MDKIQQEFEDWMESNGQLTLKEDDGEYSFQHTRLAFEAWKASRASLCVEIPEIGEQSSFCDYVVFDADTARKILDDAGVSYK